MKRPLNVHLMSSPGRLVRCLSPKTPNNGILNNATRNIQNCFFQTERQLFDEIPHRDISSLNSVLATYSRNGNAISTWNLFYDMHRMRSDLNSYTFTPVLRSCSALPNPVRGVQVHALMVKTGSDLETITKTALIDMYSKYGLLNNSVRVFDEIGFKDVVTWNAVLSSFLRHGLPLKALGIFEEMRKENVEFSEFTLCAVLKACDAVKAYRQGKQVHALVILMGRDLVILSTALIDFYSNAGYVDEAMKIYSGFNWRKDDVMHNSLISGCVRNKRYDVALSIMSTMRPKMFALTSALSACSENSDLWIGKQIHGVAIRQGFTVDTQLCNVLLNMYAKCGKISIGRLVFNEIPHKDVISWTSMIVAYGSHGHGMSALELYSEMGKEGNTILPNAVTFLAVLSACGHSGMVEQGRECFVSVQKKYGIDPGPEHYACFIDILGRAGEIEEAWSLLHDMVKSGKKPTVAVWAALLNACTINQDVTRGEFAAKRILKLETNKPGIFVALSNLYAAAGKWDSFDSLRSTMKNRGISKEAGNSWVTVSSGSEKLKTPSAFHCIETTG